MHQQTSSIIALCYGLLDRCLGWSCRRANRAALRTMSCVTDDCNRPICHLSNSTLQFTLLQRTLASRTATVRRVAAEPSPSSCVTSLVAPSPCIASQAGSLLCCASPAEQCFSRKIQFAIYILLLFKYNTWRDAVIKPTVLTFNNVPVTDLLSTWFFYYMYSIFGYVLCVILVNFMLDLIYQIAGSQTVDSMQSQPLLLIYQ